MKLKNIPLLRSIALFMGIALMAVLPAACSNDSLIDEVPQPVNKFVTQYFPGYAIITYEHTDTGYHVRLKNGPGMNFDASYNWESLDGYGLPLPQVFLFDQTPPKLYAYLQGTSSLNEVFSISRTSEEYTVTLLDNTLVYDISTEEISSPK